MEKFIRIIAMLLFFNFNAFSQTDIQWTGIVSNDMSDSENWLTTDGANIMSPIGNNLIISEESTFSIDINNFNSDNAGTILFNLFNALLTGRVHIVGSMIYGTVEVTNQPKLTTSLSVASITINPNTTVSISTNANLSVSGEVLSRSVLSFNHCQSTINTLNNLVGGILTFDDGADVTVLEGMNNSNDVLINPNAHLTLNKPSDVTKKSLENSGLVTIRSNDTGTGSLISKGSISNADATSTDYFEIERWFDVNSNKSNWHLISSPTTEECTGTFMGHFLNKYNEAQGSFKAISSKSELMRVCEGYVAKLDFASNDGVTDNSNPIVFKRFKPNTGPQTANLVNGDGNTYFNLPGNFNLVGNPYTSNLDWNVLWVNNQNIVDATLYYYVDNGSDEGDVNGWKEFNANSNIGYGNGLISIGQAFGVLQTDTDQNAIGTLSFTSDAQTHNGGNIFTKRNKSFNEYFELNAKYKDFTDKIFFRFNENTSSAYDGNYDAYKFRSFGETPTPYFVSSDSKRLAICEMPESESVDLGFAMDTNGEVTFSVSNVQDFEEIILEDKFENTFTDLTKTSYSFNHDVSEKEVGRFTIHFKKSVLSDREEEVGMKVYSNRKTLFIKSNKTLNHVIVNMYNTSGQLVISRDYTSLNDEQIDCNISNGIYVVNVISDENNFTNKINIK
jgi:hypothetical protein